MVGIGLGRTDWKMAHLFLTMKHLGQPMVPSRGHTPMLELPSTRKRTCVCARPPALLAIDTLRPWRMSWPPATEKREVEWRQPLTREVGREGRPRGRVAAAVGMEEKRG